MEWTKRIKRVSRATATASAALGFCACLVLQSAAEPGVQRALLSLDDLHARRGEQIKAFDIKTWGVTLLAICQVPQDWQLKAEKYEDPAGELSGRLDTHGEPLTTLRDMYLVEVYDQQSLAKDSRPASFSGWVDIGTVAPFGGGSRHRRPLREANFRLRHARRCPEPPPAQP
ncbi:MAG TPA: hypothetical protein VG248_09420 [Caulobacteraceae bacterium]|nr:hypothetical protein [Caulobacteraceae bacterium]